MQLHFLELARAFKEAPFTTSEVRRALGVSKTTVFRFMTWAYESGKVERLAHSQTLVKYKIAS